MKQWYYAEKTSTLRSLQFRGNEGPDCERLAYAVDLVWPQGSDRTVARAAHEVPEFSGLFRIKPATPALPDWLRDVAAVETRGPVPLLGSSHEIPQWLEDLQLWYAAPLRPDAPSRPACAPTPAGPAPETMPEIMVKKTVLLADPALSRQTMPATTGEEPKVPSPALAVSPQPSQETPPDTGFDAETGRILDPEKFQRWLRQKVDSPDSDAAATNGSLMHRCLSRCSPGDRAAWVDDDSWAGMLILGANIEEIISSAELQILLEQFAEFGPIMKSKLLKHLTFMVENRKRYFAVCPE